MTLFGYEPDYALEDPEDEYEDEFWNQDPQDWGSYKWHDLMLTVSQMPPNSPPKRRLWYKILVESSIMTVPCGNCLEHGSEYLSKNPIRLDQEARDALSLFEYVYNMRESVRARRGKPQTVTFKQACSWYKVVGSSNKYIPIPLPRKVPVKVPVQVKAPVPVPAQMKAPVPVQAQGPVQSRTPVRTRPRPALQKAQPKAVPVQRAPAKAPVRAQSFRAAPVQKAPVKAPVQTLALRPNQQALNNIKRLAALAVALQKVKSKAAVKRTR